MLLKFDLRPVPFSDYHQPKFLPCHGTIFSSYVGKNEKGNKYSEKCFSNKYRQLKENLNKILNE
jgi:hypothetical protein